MGETNWEVEIKAEWTSSLNGVTAALISGKVRDVLADYTTLKNVEVKVSAKDRTNLSRERD